MKIVPPVGPHHPTAREFHRRRCYLLGITEEWKEEKLWAAEVERVKSAKGG
jgi:hypothetical protein